jgi:L-alanine-DL-glutamate epimerase-like enolase superfamily enzyme
MGAQWAIQDAGQGWIEVRLRQEFRTNMKLLRVHRNVGFRLTAGGRTGWGEAYTMEPDSAAEALSSLSISGRDPWSIDSLLEPVTNLAARSALDLALHDTVTRLLEISLHRFLGLDSCRAVTSASLSLGSFEDVLKEAKGWIDAGYRILKLKMGADTDPALPVRLRDEIGPDVRLRVDGNQAWTLDGFRHVAPCLQEAGVEFCEQPFPVGQSELCAEAGAEGIPIFLDEEVTGPEDVARVWRHGGVQGVNVKLSKCGGIRRSLETIRVARRLGLSVMIGCFFETSLATGAAVHLCSLADAVDLDAPLFLESDPMTGLTYENGGPHVAGIGIGVQPKEALF